MTKGLVILLCTKELQELGCTDCACTKDDVETNMPANKYAKQYLKFVFIANDWF